MRRKEYKSPEYLDFVGGWPCCVTGATHNVDVHHESLVSRFTGSRKRKFDFGAVPLEHELHLEDRHRVGKTLFWERHDVDPYGVAIDMLTTYLETSPHDYELAEEALELLVDERDRH